MSEFQAHITRLHSDHSFEQFSRSINGELSDATTISLNPNFGRGFIRKLNPEPGVSVRLWNAILNQPARVFKHAIPRSANKGFNLVYILTPEHCQLKTISTHTQFIQFDTRVCYLLAEDVAYDFELSPFHPLQVVDCSITSAWLKEQFEKKVLPADIELAAHVHLRMHVSRSTPRFRRVVHADNVAVVPSHSHDRVRIAPNLILVAHGDDNVRPRRKYRQRLSLETDEFEPLDARSHIIDTCHAHALHVPCHLNSPTDGGISPGASASMRTPMKAA